MRAFGGTTRGDTHDWEWYFETTNFPLFKQLYKRVEDGTEAGQALEWEDVRKEVEALFSGQDLE